MGESTLLRYGEHNVVRLVDPDHNTDAMIHATYGFNLFSFRVPIRGKLYDVLKADDHFADQPGRAAGNGTPVLFPFPNRIAAGRFRWHDQEYRLPRNERNVNAIHGFVLDKPWSVKIKTDDSAVRGSISSRWQLAEASQQWPGQFELRGTITLKGRMVSLEFEVQNIGDRPLPWGFGLHPYFRLPLEMFGKEEACLVRVPARQMWELEDYLPTGRVVPPPPELDLREPRRLSELKLDHVYTDLERNEWGWVECVLEDQEAGYRLNIRCSEKFREIVVYTPPNRGSICIEPYTCATNAINLQAQGIDAGLRITGVQETEKIGTVVFEVVEL